MNRREFLSFFLIGGLFGWLRKRLLRKEPQRVALFWKRQNP